MRSVYDPVEYCKLPQVMEHAYKAPLAFAGAAGSPSNAYLNGQLKGQDDIGGVQGAEEGDLRSKKAC
jgi:hypothetical protein